MRYDPLQCRWVIIAPGRAQRPADFVTRQEVLSPGVGCPFCPGHEADTEPEIVSKRDDASHPNFPGWRIRVVRNLYPALIPELTLTGESEDGIYRKLSGVGEHEVIVEGPDHTASLAEFDPSFTTEILEIYQQRLTALSEDLRLRSILIFKNQGVASGATLSHPHSQIIATVITPRTVKIELNASREHYQETGRCLICDMIHQEVSGNRVIFNDGELIAFNSYAARFPYELFIAPLHHQAQFELEQRTRLQHLAVCLKFVAARLKSALGDPSYNYILHTAPNLMAKPSHPGYWTTIARDYHWHIEVIPRLTRTAGFEWGSGLHINPMPPEQAAKVLRGDSDV